jgi:hypothetical protein
MRSLNNIVVRSALAVLTSSIFTVLAQAQGSTASQGSFVLPVETQWGQVVLPPGPYTYRLSSDTGAAIVTVRGQAKTAMIMVNGGTSLHAISNRSSLNLIRSGQHGFVQSFDIGHLGTTFFYRLPKDVEARRQMEAAATVPVTVAKK